MVRSAAVGGLVGLSTYDSERSIHATLELKKRFALGTGNPLYSGVHP